MIMPTWFRCLPLVMISVLFVTCERSFTEDGMFSLKIASDASNPTIAIDDSREEVYVAWVGFDGEERNVYLSSSSLNDIDFSDPVQVNDLPNDAGPHSEAPAQVRVGPEGNIYVLWHNDIQQEDRRFAASNLRFARSTDKGKTYSSAIYVNHDHEGTMTGHNFHDMTVASDGNIYVSWLESRDQPNRPEVRVARSVDGGQSFEQSVVVAKKVCTCCRTAVAAAADGTFYVLYRSATPENVRDIMIARSDDQCQSFTQPITIHDDGWVLKGCPHSGSDIQIGDSGDIHVVWYTGQEDRIGVHYTVSRDRGESFETPRYLNSYINGSLIRCALALDKSENPFFAIEGADLTGSKVYLLEPEQMKTGRIGGDILGDGIYPAAAMNAKILAVAWLDGESIQATLKKL